MLGANEKIRRDMAWPAGRPGRQDLTLKVAGWCGEELLTDKPCVTRARSACDCTTTGDESSLL